MENTDGNAHAFAVANHSKQWTTAQLMVAYASSLTPPDLVVRVPSEKEVSIGDTEAKVLRARGFNLCLSEIKRLNPDANFTNPISRD